MVKWDDKFEVGIELIDSQHKELLNLCNKVYDLLKNSREIDCYDEIMNILHELNDYTLYHFNSEEELMQKYNYDEISLHKIEHKFFVKKLEKIFKMDIDKDQIDSLQTIMDFVIGWVSHHIVDVDKKLKNYIK